MGKRKGRLKHSEFAPFSDAEFVESFYSRRADLPARKRRRIEREAKARGLRNVAKERRR